jgi:hypothetical protein
MKIKQLRNDIENKNKDTKLTPLPGQRVEIWHTQEIKQSANWQSASASYGCKIIVADNDKSITEGIKRAEEIVEGALVEKASQQKELLRKLGE